jgi:eukaryotic-like serine/threonine-protein kinase
VSAVGTAERAVAVSSSAPSHSRRFFFVRVAVCISAAVALSACDWSEFRGGPTHPGFSSDQSISKAAVAAGDLVPDWTATTGDVVFSSPAVAKKIVYVGSNDNSLYAFDATGSTHCSGSPKSCTPIWKTNTLGGDVPASPSVVNGLVYIASLGGTLFAFDAAGSTNCSGGVPRICAPVWTAATTGDVIASPTVAVGRVFVVSANGFPDAVYAFDATDGTPLWSAPGVDLDQHRHTHSAPAVAKGVVYVGLPGGSLDPRDVVAAFDAAGNTGCSGTAPARTCEPMWADDVDGLPASPTVINGVLYVQADRLYAFDAAGVTNCSGTPKHCAPLWTAAGSAGLDSSPAVVNGVVYDGAAAYDAAGVTNCSGVPKTCAPLWTETIGGVAASSPSVANGVVYLGSTDSKLYAFDADGTINCSGIPKSCAPLWSSATGGAVASSPAISNGFVYVGSADHKLHAFRLLD